MYVDLSQRAPHQVAHASALTEGLKRHGVLGEFRNVVACWGWKNGARHRCAGRDVLVLERGYIGDRFAWTSIGWNGLNGRATFPMYPDDGGARFRRMRAPLVDWRTDGEFVLLVGQVHGDAALQGRDLSAWYADTAKAAADAYELPVLFRPHPLEARRLGVVRTVAGTAQDMGELGAALARAAVVVTWNSNTGVDALLAGKITVAHDSGAMAWPVCGHRLGDRGSIDRESWAHALAWKQWSMDEIRSGDALVGIVEDVRNGRFGQGRRPGRDRAEAAPAA